MQFNEIEKNVSRETIEKLETYAKNIIQWNDKINLVSSNTTKEIWDRHIVDSLQLISIINKTNTWCDMGSGGGLPGIVVAIIYSEKSPATKITLIESDQRKSAFLKIISQKLNLNTEIISQRIEKSNPIGADVVSARALAPLTALLSYTKRHMNKSGRAVFLKGKNYKEEIEIAKKSWNFDIEVIKSKTDSQAAVLLIKDIQSVS